MTDYNLRMSEEILLAQSLKRGRLNGQIIDHDYHFAAEDLDRKKEIKSQHNVYPTTFLVCPTKIVTTSDICHF